MLEINAYTLKNNDCVCLYTYIFNIDVCVRARVYKKQHVYKDLVMRHVHT